MSLNQSVNRGTNVENDGVGVHTPGPWEVGGLSAIGGHTIRNFEGVELAIVPGGGKRGDGRANARLIAAAPELLAIARKIVENPWWPGGSWGRADAAMRAELRAAIAKATQG